MSILTKLTASFLAIIFLTISACKKKEEEIVRPQPEISYLCTGKGSSSYFPLAINNEWSYPSFFGNSRSYFIRKTISFRPYTYYELTSNYGGQSFFREDTNGDIITVDTSLNTEIIYLPNSPVLFQYWLYPGGVNKSVTSISTSITTNDCVYNDCLEITFKDQNNAITRKEYYKRGIGKVSYTDYPSPGLGSPTTTQLNRVVLN